MWSAHTGGGRSGSFSPLRVTLLGFLILGLLASTFAPASGVLAADAGAVLVWGDNRSTQLGSTEKGVERATPGAVSAAVNSGVIAISASGSHTLALKTDGSVLTWGSNFPSGQLGQGSTEDRLDPGPVQGLAGATAIAAGSRHNLAVAGGTVYAWGDNNVGQLGTTSAQTCNAGACSRVAIPVGGLSGVTTVGAGRNHSLAIKSDGTLWAWGTNSAGQLGDNSTSQRNTPVQVVGPDGVGTLTGIIAATGGETHTLALKGDGTVWAWGGNVQGQLGLGAADTQIHDTPAQVPGLNGIVAIASGYRFSLALRGDGAVFAWGFNDGGQLGNGALGTGTCGCVAAPAQVGGVAGAVAIGAGDAHSLAVLADGTVRAWGDNGSGQIGVGTPEKVTTATQVPGLQNARAVDGGGAHSVVLRVAPQFALTVSTNGSGTGTVTPGTGGYDAGSQVTLTAQATGDSIFTGWSVDGQSAGWTNPLTITMDKNRTVIATFNKVPDFCDVDSGDLYYEAIRQLAARGVIRGFEREDGALCFAPDQGTKRAQMAALIARPLGWDLEDHGNPFSDQGTIDANLWRNVGALAHYNVARGYKPETCLALGVAAPCYGPEDPVVHAQVISFITRGMVEKGYWQYQPDNAALYPNVLADSGHRVDIATYLHYVGGTLPGTSSTGQTWAAWDQPAVRAWFAEAEWRALNSYFGLD
jgi:alpha-tubulin suppressor-like RCC1 family protein